mmetsp:Transcript_2549/g.3892  ORF Transcript_2549/g.3892 Transcript_2549/m.3892 type:complete len:81 (+) Transcript_2549:1750-1992(+)
MRRGMHLLDLMILVLHRRMTTGSWNKELWGPVLDHVGVAVHVSVENVEAGDYCDGGRMPEVLFVSLILQRRTGDISGGES